MSRRRSSRRIPARRAGKAEQPAGPVAFWIRHRLVLRVWLLFLVLFAAQMAFFGWADPVITPRINAGTAWITGQALRLLGNEVQVEGAGLYTSLYPLRIIWECTGVTPVCLYLSAVLAFPACWRRKLLGVLLGVPALLLINTGRLVSLVYVGHWFPDLFETVHVLVWQSLLILIVVILWLFWVSWVTDERTASPA